MFARDASYWLEVAERLLEDPCIHARVRRIKGSLQTAPHLFSSMEETNQNFAEDLIAQARSSPPEELLAAIEEHRREGLLTSEQRWFLRKLHGLGGFV